LAAVLETTSKTVAKTYAALLAETVPVRIDTVAECNRSRHILAVLLRQVKRTTAERKLIGLLTVLIEDYDRRHALPPDEVSPAERLLFLMERSGKHVLDLLPVFGQRRSVHEALTGKRPISATEARNLGRLFHVKPIVFSLKWHA
jgi:antitoxin component HigA of HigAB toxin-antitoxin module